MLTMKNSPPVETGMTVAEETLRTASRTTARMVVRHTARLKGDLGSAARNIVQGAICAARDLGLDVRAAASAAAEGATEAAGELGCEAARNVRRALLRTVDGILVAVRQPTVSKESQDPSEDLLRLALSQYGGD